MKSMIPSMLVVIALEIWVICGIPTAREMTLIGSIMLALVLPLVFVMIWRAGKRNDNIKVESTVIFEDPKRRERNRRHHLTTFCLSLSNGNTRVVTVRDGTEKYQEYMAMRRE